MSSGGGTERGGGAEGAVAALTILARERCPSNEFLHVHVDKLHNHVIYKLRVDAADTAVQF